MYMLSDSHVRCIMTMHNLKYKPLKDFNNDYEKFMQWHIEQFQERLKKYIRFLIAINIMGIIALTTALYIYAIS